MHLGDSDGARDLFDEALALFRTVRYPRGIGWSLQHLAEVADQQGNLRQAAVLRGETIELYWQERDTWGMFEELASLASIAARAGEPVAAVRLLSAGETLREAVGAAPQKRLASRGETVRLLHVSLGQSAFEAGWAEGRTLSAEQAVQEAGALAQRLGGHGSSSSTIPAAPTLPASLFEREAEVLRLVAQGLTNAEIGEWLYLSPRTVGAHVYNIYRKVGVSSRAAATRFAAEHGLS